MNLIITDDYLEFKNIEFEKGLKKAKLIATAYELRKYAINAKAIYVGKNVNEMVKMELKYLKGSGVNIHE